MHEKLEPELARLDPGLQVDVLWALCVLQQAREAELQAVLRPEFHCQFLGECRGPSPIRRCARHPVSAAVAGVTGHCLQGRAWPSQSPPRGPLSALRTHRPSFCRCPPVSLHLLSSGSGSPKDQSTFQKLLHINSTARLEHPTYTGPFLPASALGARPSADRKATPFQKELQETLKGLLGSSDRGSFVVATQYGWVLGEGPPLSGPLGVGLAQPESCGGRSRSLAAVPSVCISHFLHRCRGAAGR